MENVKCGLHRTGTARTPTIDSGPNTTFSLSKYVMFVCTLSKTEKEAINPSSPPSDTSKQKATQNKKRQKKRQKKNDKKSDNKPLVLILLVNCSSHIQRSTGSRIIATSPTSDPTLVRGGVAATPQQPMPVPLVPVSKNDESLFQQKKVSKGISCFHKKRKQCFNKKVSKGISCFHQKETSVSTKETRTRMFCRRWRC